MKTGTSITRDIRRQIWDADEDWSTETGLLRDMADIFWGVIETFPEYITLYASYFFVFLFITLIAVRLSIYLWLLAGLLYVETTCAELRNMRDAMRLGPGDDC